jgi:hypothetical protein
MNAPEFLSSILEPGIAWCEKLPGWTIPFDDRARVLMIAIAGQESGWQNIAQGGGGPGRGPWQFETETCTEVIKNPASAKMALIANEAAGLSVHGTTYDSLISKPDLAVAFARLDLWCNPSPLPAVDWIEDAWKYYLATWRPGKPRLDDWPANYEAAVAAVKGQTS